MLPGWPLQHLCRNALLIVPQKARDNIVDQLTGIAMPTLIRLFIVLLVLAGLVFGGHVRAHGDGRSGRKGHHDQDSGARPGARRPIPTVDIEDLPAPVNVAAEDSSSRRCPSGRRSDVKTVAPVAPE